MEMCSHDKREERKQKREEAKIFEDHAVGTYQDSRLVSHVPIGLSFLICKFIEKRITKYLLKSTAEKTGKWLTCTMYLSCKWK